MDIKRLDVQSYSASSLRLHQDGIFHKKSLPMLSVVQALEGSYEIGLGAPKLTRVGPGEVFVAPADVMQYIIHHLDPQSGMMRAHWIFLDVAVNGFWPLDRLFAFPLILPHSYEENVRQIITTVETGSSGICGDLSAIYQLLGILLAIGTEQPVGDSRFEELRRFAEQHYRQKWTMDTLAAALSVSVPTLFRQFRRFFGMTPAHYMNLVRLRNACVLLEQTDQTIGEIASEIGFEDPFYFSRLFKEQFGQSPTHYRGSWRSGSHGKSDSQNPIE